MILKLEIKAEDFIKRIKGIIPQSLKQDIEDGARSLAVMTHSKVQEYAQQNLRSLRRIYLNNLTFENPQPGFWVITLNSGAMFVEEGMKAGFMDWLLKRNVKVDKKGRKYRTIPFRHNLPPSEQTPTAQMLTNQIKEFLRKKKIPFQKIELNEQGSPRIGRLHRFNIDFPRLKEKHKTSPLHGVTIYQIKNPHTGTIERHIVTFRTIHEKHRSEGLWYHPGLEARKFMDKAFNWALREWEEKIVPEILAKY